ncbi:alternate-type signal peptide domain-containing protein [Nocardioides acrostichi]|uniref:Alternate-type signal peptide domain-containing protein n=1 Tax=Nocardioides acrostichi TaxID=2784339 RepID=A0A930Y6P4_9ACTN|nr:alternate-type signal peptide domain-containing protein [Nocardioides acrostichi]MBF4161197.1 alternate-type signal peptide domain-containing protein [Nocardioides acrostichi]
MKSALKATLASGAGVALLLGGAGSLAYWNDTTVAQPGDLVSGTLTLGDSVCGDWTLDGAQSFDPASDKIVPGDSLTLVCDSTIAIEGKHAAADLSATAAGAVDNLLEDQLTIGATYAIVNSDATTRTPSMDGSTIDLTEADNGKELRATISVGFADAAPNDSKALTAALDDITITATQQHDAS